ncbi:MAG: hypothetical protein AAF757_22390, partial [Cyanobacteria bacterium P01_D01_bin.116]
MSEDNKNIQPPADSPTQNSSSPEKLPFWKASLVKALRGTIGLLETTAVQLETKPSPSSEKKPGFLQKLQQIWIGILGKIRLILPARFSAKLSDTALTGIIGGLIVMVFLISSNVFDSKPSQVATVPPDTEIPPTTTTEIQSIPSEEQEILSVIEEETPPQQEIDSLPTEDKQEIPTVIEEKTSSQQEIASLPTEEKTETITKDEQKTLPEIESQETTSLTTKEKAITETEDEVKISPVIEQETILQSEEASVKTENEIKISPVIEETAPQEELEKTSPPRLLTPEETLIAEIQNQVGEISFNSKEDKSTNRTFAGIIESIKANFFNSNLTIKINNQWYSLEKSQQDNLAAQILQRSQELDFTHLELIDLQDK